MILNMVMMIMKEILKKKIMMMSKNMTHLKKLKKQPQKKPPKKPPPPEKFYLKSIKKDMVFIDSAINVKRSKQDILYYIPQDLLNRMRYVDKTEGKLKKTTRNELVSLAHDNYIDNEADAREFVKYNTRLVK